MTKIQLLERQIKDWKIKYSNLEAKQKDILEERKYLYETIRKLDLKVDSLNSEITGLRKENAELKEIIATQNIQINNLISRIKKDSSNSSKPPSTDGFDKKIQNSREKTNRKAGGQPGHKGHTLNLFEEPTKVIEHKESSCCCGGEILYESEYIAKQIVDIKITPKIEEHRVFYGVCSKCKKRHNSKFPENVKSLVQYGNMLKTLVTVLINEGMVSMERTVDLINSISAGKLKLSEGTIVNFNKELSNKSTPLVAKIKEHLIKSEVLHVDESGVRINGKIHWIHTACSEDATLYEINKKRGTEATDEIGILAYFVGVLVHDHLKSYYKYETMEHSECNAHILRYLKSIVEIFKREEAEAFLSFIVELNNQKKVAVEQGQKGFDSEKIEKIENEYSSKLNIWKKKYDETTNNLTKKQKEYYNDERCLFERLIKYKDEHLRFIKDFKVPFDNNIAERSLRMIKAKIKISGGFRSENGGNFFSNIRSIISTLKKRKLNPYDTILKIFNQEDVAII